MATSETRVYSPRGVVALDPQAYGLEWAKQTTGEAFSVAGKCAVVCINGPTVYQRTPDNWFLTYAEITAAVRAAAEAAGTSTIVLKINSPGGEVAGAFDCARDVRAIAQAAGKQLIAFTESQACSAAYGLACAADEIIISDVASVGSIGVITMIADATNLDAALGVRFSVVTSGARKADGNPHVPTSDAAVEAVQATVDAIASVFFAHVSERRGVAPESVAALQAGTFVGNLAIGVGLANRVESFSSLVSRLENPPLVHAESNAMADEDKDEKKEDATRASLVTASESDDPEKAAKAKRALAAYDAAESDDDDKDKKDDKEEASASALAAAVAPLARQVSAQQAELNALKAKADAADRQAIFAARPDLSPELIKSLEATPTKSLKAVVGAIPVSAGFVNPYVAETKTPPTVGGAGDRPIISANADLNKKMGLVKSESKGVTYNGGIQTFGGRK